MNDFTFYSPTKVFFGKDKEKEIGKIIVDYNHKRVLFVYGQNSIKKTGLYDKVVKAKIPSMIVTMGDQGAVYATKDGEKGICPARKVHVKDTTGAGDAFCAGVSIGLTYEKTMADGERLI